VDSSFCIPECRCHNFSRRHTLNCLALREVGCFRCILACFFEE
jgi:hypothetical protein